MVKIVFDLLDVLSPDSRAAYQQLIVKRFNDFCVSNPRCNEELVNFCRDHWHPEDNISYGSPSNNDRYALIRAFCSRGCVVKQFAGCARGARAAIYRTEAQQPQFSSSTAATQSMTESMPMMERNESYCFVDDDLDRLHLSSDAPIVRCLLGLSQLPDVSLWLLCLEPARFASHILRRLPVAPFFEGVCKLWRVLDAMSDDEASMTTFAHLRLKMNALAHETLVRVSESRCEAEEACANGWLGVHLIQAGINRSASIETFSDYNLSGRSPVSSAEQSTAALQDATKPVRHQHQTQSNARQVETARGIAALGRKIIQSVPELAAAMSSIEGCPSPMLFAKQSQPSKKFCVCNCFWTGVATGVAAAITSVVGFSLVMIVATATLRSLGVKRKGTGSSLSAAG